MNVCSEITAQFLKTGQLFKKCYYPALFPKFFSCQDSQAPTSISLL